MDMTRDVELTSVGTEGGIQGGVVLEPDGLHDEHRPLRSSQDTSNDYQAKYISMDPSR
jgi:hypothetical protein